MAVSILAKTGVVTSLSDVAFAAQNPAVSVASFLAQLKLDLTATRELMRVRPLTWGDLVVSAEKDAVFEMWFLATWHAKFQLGNTPYDNVSSAWTIGDFIPGDGVQLAMDKADGSPIMMDADNTYGSAVEGSYNNGILDSIFLYLQDLRMTWKTFWDALVAASGTGGTDALKKANMLAVYETWRDEANWTSTVV